MNIIDKLIRDINELSNEELIDLLKEIKQENKNNKLSYNGEKLFKLYDESFLERFFNWVSDAAEWYLGIDRFVEIRKLLEMEVIERIEKDMM